ncbi:hypothetical protein BHE74_00034978 [Ensete ventricosum]|nr:hypothetical protein BHE74_00034978 [Ensete ventricosum]
MGQPATAKAPMQRCDRLRQGPLQWGAGYGQGQRARGRCPPAARPQGQPPEGGRLQRDGRKGRQPSAATPQGLLPTVCRRSPAGYLPVGRGTARKGCRLHGRPPATVAPAGAVPATGVAAPWQSGCRRARAAVACAEAAAATATQ